MGDLGTFRRRVAYLVTDILAVAIIKYEREDEEGSEFETGGSWVLILSTDC